MNIANRTQSLVSLRIKLPDSLHDEAEANAQKEGLTLHDYIVAVVSEAMSEKDGPGSEGPSPVVEREILPLEGPDNLEG